MNKCKQCGKEFEGIRSSSQYCSDACKTAFYRNKERKVSVTEKEESVTLSPVTVNPVTLSDDDDVTLSDRVMGPNGYYYGQELTKRVIDGKSWPDRTVGFCRKCGKEIDRETHPNNWDLWEVCLKCT